MTSTCGFAKNAVFMFFYEQWRRNMGDKLGDLMLPVTGAIVGKIASTAVTFPLENVATMQQDAKVLPTNRPKKCIRSTFRKLSKGVSSMMCYEVSLSAVWWFSYHNTFIYLNREVFQGENTSTSVFLSGAVGAFFGALAAHPFDLARVVKVIDPKANEKMSIFGTLKGIVRSHGPKALTIGLGARLLRL